MSQTVSVLGVMDNQQFVLADETGEWINAMGAVVSGNHVQFSDMMTAIRKDEDYSARDCCAYREPNGDYLLWNPRSSYDDCPVPALTITATDLPAFLDRAAKTLGVQP